MYLLIQQLELLQITMAQLSVGLGLGIGIIAGTALPARYCELPQAR